MRITTVAALVALCLPAFGQDFKSSFAKRWAVSKDFTLAVAQAMPADQYGFAPSPDEMNFGMLMVHIAMANNGTFSRVAGIDAPPVPEKIAAARKDPKTVLDKDMVIKYLTESFDFCADALQKTSADKFATMSGPEGRQMSGAERLWAYFTHTAHHRGQAEVYLRVKNIKPPDYKF